MPDKKPILIKNEITGEYVIPTKYRTPVLHNEPKPWIEGTFADLGSSVGNFLLRITGVTQKQEPVDVIITTEETPQEEKTKSSFLPIFLIGGGILLLFFFFK